MYHAISLLAAYVSLTLLLRLWGVEQEVAMLTGIAFVNVLGLGRILDVLKYGKDDEKEVEHDV